MIYKVKGLLLNLMAATFTRETHDQLQFFSSVLNELSENIQKNYLEISILPKVLSKVRQWRSHKVQKMNAAFSFAMHDFMSWSHGNSIQLGFWSVK